MNELPTPETDAESCYPDSNLGECVCADFARKLERERDESRKIADAVAWDRDEAKRIYDIEATEHMLNINEICNQRDAAMDALMDISFYPSSGIGDDNTTVQEYKDRILDGIKHLKQERDEARNIAEKLSKQGLDIMDENRSLKRERDTALDEAQAYSKGTWQSLRDSQDEVLRLAFENREISQELEEARDTIMKIEEIFVDGENTHDDWFKMGSIAKEYFKK